MKIPNLEALKKMGSSIIDSAKGANVGEMIDKLKSGIDSVGENLNKNTQPTTPAQSPNDAFTTLQNTLAELVKLQAAQVLMLEKANEELNRLRASVIENK